jgi:hypothetical protein
MMGYRWKVGKGDRIRFCEDQWFGTCSLGIQYRGIYSMINEQGATIRESCDGVNLKFTFRSTVDCETTCRIAEETKGQNYMPKSVVLDTVGP